MSEQTEIGCERVLDELASVLDGSASPELLDHVASCDSCRDARYDAERAEALISEAGADFELPQGFAARLVGRSTPVPALTGEAPATAPKAESDPAMATVTMTAPMPAAAPAPDPAPAPAPTSVSPRLPPRAVAFAKRWTIPILAAAAAAVILGGRAKDPSTSASDPDLGGTPWRGKVSKLLTRDGKLRVCAPTGNACHEAREGDDVPAGSELRSDQRTLAELQFADGSTLSMDRETTLRLSTRGRGAELRSGGVVADVAHEADTTARFDFRAGHVDVLGTKFSLRADDESATVHVARGEVRLADTAGHSTPVSAGQEGRVFPGSQPVASSGTALGEALGWSDVIEHEPDALVESRPRALGELRAKKPGERDERAGAVNLTSHAVHVKIAGSVARTEVEEVFSNQTDDVLEGIFRFPLPPDAKLERLALEVDGKLEEGAFVDRDRASAIWRGAIVNAAPQLRHEIKDEIVWVPGPWRDPALLEWQRGGRFELRIYPIPRRGSRRVVLAYSQLVPQAAQVRHYSYPLGFDPSLSQAPLDFSLDVTVRGQDPSFHLKTPGWTMQQRQDDGAVTLSYDAHDFQPNGDFGLDYALPDRSQEVSAWAYQDAAGRSEPYVALALRPRLPKREHDGAGRAVALVVDSSRSVFGENYRRATEAAVRLTRELGPNDRVAVLSCDSTCRQMPGELRIPSADTTREVRRFLEHETPDGASDVTRAVAEGFRAVGQSARRPEVVYIGDGTATVGPTRPASIERTTRAGTPASGRVTALGIGPESDGDSLLALARGGRGTALPYVPGQPLSDVVLAALSAISESALADVELELPAGISQVSPRTLDPIVAGSEVIVTGRLQAQHVQGDAILRGTVGGKSFEQRYPLDITASDSSGNAFVPRLFGAARIADLERDGSDAAKREAIGLSTELGVASRYTSLLVLESEAMYRAFGLDTSRKATEYTAGVEADGSSSSGELALSEDEEKNKDLGTLGGLSGIGSSAAGKGEVASADKEKAAPRPRRSSPAPEDAYGYGRNAYGPSTAGEPLLERGGGGAVGPRGNSGFAPPPAPVTAAKPAPAAPRSATAAGAPRIEMDEREAPRATPFAPRKKASVALDGDDTVLQPREPFELRDRPRRMIPMRRIWERKGEIFTDRFVPKAAGPSALSDAEQALARGDLRRDSLKKLFALTQAAGDLSEASRLAERWIEKEPLDPEALTALADVEARRGHRDEAIRLLGSVLDVRPTDTASHKRLARLERWAGHDELACRHAIAMAENRGQDVELVADAVRCARQQSMPEIAEMLLDSATPEARASIEQRASAAATPSDSLNGDVRLEASWSGGADLDLALLDTEGHRISWLGAGTRSVISARDATSSSSEGLALRGAAPGEYVVEITRGGGTGTARGELVLNVAGNVRRIPFSLDGDRKTLALLRVTMQPKLVPL